MKVLDQLLMVVNSQDASVPIENPRVNPELPVNKNNGLKKKYRSIPYVDG
jgi:hypothetical protein